MEEKRKYNRFNCSRERRFIAKYENQDRVFGEVNDFSRSGISFNSGALLNKEDELILDLQISGLEQKIPANIQILWAKRESWGYAYGARLINISPEDKFEIMDLLYQDWKKDQKNNLLLN